MDVVRTIEIDAEAESRLREMAWARGSTPREMVEDYIAQEAAAGDLHGNLPIAPGAAYPETPEVFREAIREARRSIERGETVSGERMDEWLGHWARGERPSKLVADGT